ncbi:MAG: flagellar biosynthesis anti-sigma factor FlgM [Proteobacteria bacterium]|nr:flagellar biosynthesis anti-sigma factor FlgM [Pseudomonadota bacterium]
MKIDNRIIHYEISKQLPKRPENEIEGMGAKQTSNEPTVEEKNQSGQDTIVNLSTASKEVQTAREIIASEPDVREDKVSELRKRIESGNYTVDNKAVADKIVESFIDEIS